MRMGTVYVLFRWMISASELMRYHRFLFLGGWMWRVVESFANQFACIKRTILGSPLRKAFVGLVDPSKAVTTNYVINYRESPKTMEIREQEASVPTGRTCIAHTNWRRT